MYGKNEIFKARNKYTVTNSCQLWKDNFLHCNRYARKLLWSFFGQCNPDVWDFLLCFLHHVGISLQMEIFQVGSTEKMTNWSKAVGDNPKHKGRIPLQVKGQTQHQKITPQPQNEKETLKTPPKQRYYFSKDILSVNSKVITCLLVR